MALKKSNNCKAPYRINQVSQRGSFVPNSKRPELNSEYDKREKKKKEKMRENNGETENMNGNGNGNGNRNGI